MGAGVVTATLMGMRQAPHATLLGAIAPLVPHSDAPFAIAALGFAAASLATTAAARLVLGNIFAAGATFGFGLALSGMTQQRKARRRMPPPPPPLAAANAFSRSLCPAPFSGPAPRRNRGGD